MGCVLGSERGVRSKTRGSAASPAAPRRRGSPVRGGRAAEQNAVGLEAAVASVLSVPLELCRRAETGGIYSGVGCSYFRRPCGGAIGH